MAVGNGELMQECTKHSSIAWEIDKETDKEGKNRGMSMERCKQDMKIISPDGLSLPNQNIIINIIK